MNEQYTMARLAGYEINFNREYFKYQPSRPLHESGDEIEAVEKRFIALLPEATE